MPDRLPSGPGGVLRRLLLLLLTALIVARPLVLGEDPGLQSDFADTSSLLLTLLSLLAAACWSLWRLVFFRPAGGARLDSDRGGFGPGTYVELGLLMTVLLVFVSA